MRYQKEVLFVVEYWQGPRRGQKPVRGGPEKTCAIWTGVGVGGNVCVCGGSGG